MFLREKAIWGVLYQTRSHVMGVHRSCAAHLIIQIQVIYLLG